MDALFSHFSLSTILRNFVCGSLFVFTAYVSNHEELNTLHIEGSPAILLLTTAAVGGGMIIYSVHRSLINPIFEALKNWFLKCSYIKSFFFPKCCLDKLLRRWKYSNEGKDNNDVISNLLSSWADYSHLCYTCGYAVFLGSLTQYFSHEELTYDYPIIIFGSIFFIAGFINDLRKQIVEDTLIPPCYRQPSTPPPSQNR